MLDRIASLTWRRPKSVLAVVAALAVAAAVYGHDVEHRLVAAGFTDPSSESQRAIDTLRGALGYDANPGLVVVVRDRDGERLDLTARRVRAEVARLTARLDAVDGVGRTIDPLEAGPRAGLIARDRGSVVIPAFLDTSDIQGDAGAIMEQVEREVRSRRLDVAFAGFAPTFDETEQQTREDLTNAELIAFPLLTVLLLLVFRGVVAAAIPLLIGVLSIVGTFFVLRVMSGLVDTSLFALNIATALSLGLAVDYALLLVSRYREELARHGPTEEAHRITVRTAGRAALFSGLTVAVALIVLVTLPQRFLYSLGVAGATVGVLSAVIALLVVPSLLRLLGPKINALPVGRRGGDVSASSDGWYRVARGVLRRPVPVALACTLVLLAAAAPITGMTLTGPSAQAAPPGGPSEAANAYVEAHYPREVTEAVTVTVRGDVPAAAVARFRTQLQRVDGVARVGPPVRASGDVAYVNLGTDAPALAARSQDAVRAIRDLAPPPGADVLVSGNTAFFVDLRESLLDHAPLLIVLMAGAVFVLLFALTGSVVLPLATLAMNTLTLAAVTGILVLAFQHGVLAGPLDYPGPDAIELVSLVFVFAVTFGLATDYAVLVLARIKERRDAGDTTEEAIAVGLARSARVITAAAAMISVVFFAFAVSPVFFMKQIAVATGLGVIIDATLVRALLVPALLRLLGDAVWWAPAPVRRLHRTVAAGRID